MVLGLGFYGGAAGGLVLWTFRGWMGGQGHFFPKVLEGGDSWDQGCSKCSKGGGGCHE